MEPTPVVLLEKNPMEREDRPQSTGLQGVGHH